jgi:hypothetical protein
VSWDESMNNEGREGIDSNIVAILGLISQDWIEVWWRETVQQKRVIELCSCGPGLVEMMVILSCIA